VDEIKNFRVDQQEEGAFDTIDRGIQSIPLDQIVGSVGRYHDFDSRFRMKQHVPQERLENIKNAMRTGRSLPPVKLYQIKDEYYALDGNHRIAAAKELGREEINAQIVEFIPSKNTLENLLYREKMSFRDQTGLPKDIDLTEIGQYHYLQKQISDHQNHLEETSMAPVTQEEAAQDWYRTIYKPLSTIIKKGGLLNFFPKRKLTDLYAYISYHQWELGQSRKYGIGIDRLIPKDMEAFRKKMSEKKETEYPEMLREITAFILVHVKPKDEFRIMEKFFALDEVAEVHSVHGDVDLLVKVMLKRDLLASDAEIIGQFVHEKMRRVPGVISTQTLIPGASRMKEVNCD
jgi:uncharacterized ParB-like nuclease family protein